ncbi:MAG: PEP/pyruvate-binding domain-containing protein, partial [Chlamydiota bacterium]
MFVDRADYIKNYTCATSDQFSSEDPTISQKEVFPSQISEIAVKSFLSSSSSIPEDKVQGGEMVMGLREQQLKEQVIRDALIFDEADFSAYGNKHENLMKLERLVNGLQLKDVFVPKPCGIKSDVIRDFLKFCKPEIFDAWLNLQTLYKNHQEPTPFLELSKTKELLKKIDGMVCEAFSTEDTFEMLKISQEFSPWLKEVKEKGGYLVVRSTGAEDSDKVVNAGANTSVSYVLPSEKEFCLALGEVVRSYFSLGSLQTRIHSKENPFDSDLKLAVTVQKLIGERIGGESDANEIPISAVLFTNEPLYIGNERFRVMRISASFGHGEGVVKNKGVEGDTLTILQSQINPDRIYVLYDNQEKKTRLAPSQLSDNDGVELVKMNNPHELIRRRVFDNDAMIARLFELGLIVEDYFQKPNDMELVVKGDKIYPVQARAVVRNKQIPTYLDLKKIEKNESLPIKKTVQLSAIVSGKASVVKITSPQEILIANSLTEVQEKQLFKEGQHKLVIVQQKEPANSHPVINFSLYGLPCLCTEGDGESVFEIVRELNDKNNELVVCTQSAALHLWSRELASVDDYVSKGFITHPANIAHSQPITELLPEDMKAKVEVPQEVRDLLFRIRAATTSEIALRALETLRKHTWLQNLSEKKATLEKHLNCGSLVDRNVKLLKESIEQLQESVDSAFNQLQ